MTPKTTTLSLPRILALVLAMLVGLSAITLGAATASHAAPSTVTVPASSNVHDMGMGGSSGVCATSDGLSRSIQGSDLLPLNRWGQATTQMHQLFLSQDHIGNATNALQRQQVVANGLGTGNSMWSMTQGLIDTSVNFCMLGTFGGAMDKIVADIGDAVFNSAVGVALVVITLMTYLFSLIRRRGAGMSELLGKMAAIGVLGVMMLGAQASTGGGSDMSGTGGSGYRPGVMSPGWIVNTLNEMTGNLAAAPAADIAIASAYNTADSKLSGLSCDAYIGEMRNKYKDRYGAWINQTRAGLPLTISTLWEDTAMQAWRTAQFGVSRTGTAQISDPSWCRMLEWNASSPVVKVDRGGTYTADNSWAPTVAGIMHKTLKLKDTSGVWNSPAFRPVGPEEYDRSAIAWAACELKSGTNGTQEAHWSIDGKFREGSIDKGMVPKPADCHKWWTDEGYDMGAFVWPTTSKEVGDKASDLDVRDYINTLHGTDNSQSTPAMVAFVVASLAILLSFGLMGLGLLVAKAAMVLLIIGLFLAVIMVLMPAGRWSKVAQVVKVLIGVMIFAWFTTFLMSLVAFLAKMLNRGGTAMLDPGSTFQILWTGLTPVMAIALLHVVFTKGLKIASPFSINGALAWGQKLGGSGAAALSGISAMSSAGRSMRERGRSIVNRRGESAGAGQPEYGQKNLIQAPNRAGVGTGIGAGASRRGEVAPAEAGVRKGPGAGVAAVVGAAGTAGAAGAAGAQRAGEVSAAAGSGASHVGVSDQTKMAMSGADRGPRREEGEDPIESVEAAGAGQGDPTRQAPEVDPQTIQKLTEDPGGAPAEALEQQDEQKGLDASYLVGSTLRNSQVGKGKLSQLGHGRMDRGERDALRRAAKLERAEAQAWDDQRRTEMGLKPQGQKDAYRKFVDHRMANISQKLHSARAQLAENPVGAIYRGTRGAVKTLGKGALIGAGVTLAGSAALAASPVLAGAALLGAGAVGVARMRRRDKKVERAQMDRLVADYRADQKATKGASRMRIEPVPVTPKQMGPSMQRIVAARQKVGDVSQKVAERAPEMAASGLRAGVKASVAAAGTVAASTLGAAALPTIAAGAAGAVAVQSAQRRGEGTPASRVPKPATTPLATDGGHRSEGRVPGPRPSAAQPPRQGQPAPATQAYRPAPNVPVTPKAKVTPKAPAPSRPETATQAHRPAPNVPVTPKAQVTPKAPAPSPPATATQAHRPAPNVPVAPKAPSRQAPPRADTSPVPPVTPPPARHSQDVPQRPTVPPAPHQAPSAQPRQRVAARPSVAGQDLSQRPSQVIAGPRQGLDRVSIESAGPAHTDGERINRPGPQSATMPKGPRE